MVENLISMWETRVWSLGREDSSPGEGTGNPLQYFCLENPMDRGAWQTMGLQKVGHDWATTWCDDDNLYSNFSKENVFLFLNLEACRKVVGCHLWGCTESDRTEATWQHYYIYMLDLLSFFANSFLFADYILLSSTGLMTCLSTQIIFCVSCPHSWKHTTFVFLLGLLLIIFFLSYSNTDDKTSPYNLSCHWTYTIFPSYPIIFGKIIIKNIAILFIEEYWY